MKKLLTTAALLLTLTFNSYAQEIQKKVTEEPLVIHSTKGKIEIKNASECTQKMMHSGSVAISCENLNSILNSR